MKMLNNSCPPSTATTRSPNPSSTISTAAANRSPTDSRAQGFEAAGISIHPAHGTGKSRELADRNVCATSERMFQRIRRRPERSREFAKLSRQDFCALAHRTPFDRIEELL